MYKCFIIILFSITSSWASEKYSSFYMDSKFFDKEERKTLNLVFDSGYFFFKNKKELSQLAHERLKMIKEKVFVKKQLNFEDILPWPDENYLFFKYGPRLLSKDSL